MVMSGLQVAQHGEHPAVVACSEGRSSLVKMLRTCFSTAPSLTTRTGRDGAVGATLGHEAEHLALAVGEPLERVLATGAGQQLRDHLGVERGAAAADAAHARR